MSSPRSHYPSSPTCLSQPSRDHPRSRPGDRRSSAAAPGTPPEPQQIGPDDFHFVQIVGRDSYGVVWEAVKVDTRETYAIKVFEKVLRMTPSCV